MSSVLISYEWAEPEPNIIAQRIIALSYALEDLVEPMTFAGEITRTDIKNHFESQSDPSGIPWQPWADSYEPWALAHGSGRILNLTGAMEDAVTSPGAYVPTDEGLFLDTSGLPEYWAWNNFGAYGRQTASTGVDEFGTIGGQENVLPERPFVGLSNAARAKMDAVFFAWMEGEISIAMSGRGSKLKSTKTGRFVSL